MSDVALHDRFFKTTLGAPKRLGQVLGAFLPPDLSSSLDVRSLTSLSSEMVGDGLDVSFIGKRRKTPPGRRYEAFFSTKL